MYNTNILISTVNTYFDQNKKKHPQKDIILHFILYCLCVERSRNTVNSYIYGCESLSIIFQAIIYTAYTMLLQVRDLLLTNGFR